MNKTKFLRVAGLIGQQAKTEELSALQAVKAFVRMLMDWVSGKYRPKAKNLIIGSLVLIYVISPIDILPAIFIDDAMIVFFALKYFKKEILNYTNWEKTQKFSPAYSEAEILND